MKKLVLAVALVVSAWALTLMASETMNGAKKDFESFKTEMAAKLESTEKDFEILKAKAAAKGGTVKAETLAEYERTRAKLQAELAEMKESSADTWSVVKQRFAKSVDSLNTKIQKAAKD